MQNADLTYPKLQRLRLTRDRPVSAQIYDFLRQAITETRIKPGTPFSENELSQHFAVSRQPVREALMRLRLDGLLTVIPQRGTLVEKISVSNLKQICFLRCAIETASIQNAPKLPEETFEHIIRQLEVNVQEQKLLPGHTDITSLFLQKDDEFHSLICSLSGCPLAWNTIQSIKGQMDRIRYLSQGGSSPYDLLISDHEGIVQALSARDFALACERLSIHLHEIMQTYEEIRRNNAQWFLSEDEEENSALS